MKAMAQKFNATFGADIPNFLLSDLIMTI